MAFDKNGKWRKRSAAVLSVALCATLSMGMFAACKPTSETEEEEPAKVNPTDTQVLKNGNFEFYSDNIETELKDKRGIVSSPDSWSFTSGSPSSDSASGIINTADWSDIAQTGSYNFSTFTKGEGDNAEEVRTFRSIDEAVQNWENSNVTSYDRIKFLDIFDDEIDELDADSESAKLFKKYSYKVDFDDIKKLNEDLPGGINLHPGAVSGEDSVLMIHNDKTSENVRGTAQYYTSSTTVTLSAGTSAKVSVWVRTDKLYHYEDTPLTSRGGAYIGVVNTVGGNTLDPMQIYNINTNGNWKQYTIYVRASTFASSSFRIVLGLGQGTSDDRYYAVDGYAFFDDVVCEKMPSSQFESEVMKDSENMIPNDGIQLCTVDSLKDEKRYDTDSCEDTTYALDLYAGFDSDRTLLSDVQIALTEEKSGSKSYTSASVDGSLSDDKGINFAQVAKLSDLENSSNIYVKNVYENDFRDKYPFGDGDSEVLMLLSANGAAYTAKLTSETFKLAPDTRMLISFFVKTSKVENGMTGASAYILDGESKTSISAFDSTTLTTVDIDDDNKDIYKGWTQCFFFLENDTEEEKTFTMQLSLGPTTIIGTTKFSYGDGYAAFTNFETKTLTKTQYGYATTGDRAQKVSLTGGVEETKKFDSVSVTDEETIKQQPALPSNYYGVSGGCNSVIEGGEKSKRPEELGVTAGILSHEYAENYFTSEESWRATLGGEAENADSWWENVFGNARQPLVIINGDQPASYGYLASASATISGSTYQRISMRVKASQGAKAYIYVMETTSENTGKALSVPLPAYTYWYDDDGNICAMDPSDKDFDEDTDILYKLQDNGLYRKVGEAAEIYYANLSSYKTDADGNLTTDSEEIVYFFHNGNFYAYRNEDKNGNYTYETLIQPLPSEITRYNNSGKGAQQAQITVEGTGDWVNVNFYVHTGDQEKSYRLEVWSGDRRGGENVNPAGSYVIFDNFSSASASSNYSDLLNASVQAIRDELNEGKSIDDENFLGADDKLPDSYEYADYYTYTFFDSAKYVRYDETTDSDNKGNPWHSYLQSTYVEQIVSLYQVDKENGTPTAYNLFLDFGATDVTTTANYPNENVNDATDNEDTPPAGDVNIWLLISSGILAVVLLFAIVVVIFRTIFSKKKHAPRVRNGKNKKGKATQSA